MLAENEKKKKNSEISNIFEYNVMFLIGIFKNCSNQRINV